MLKSLYLDKYFKDKDEMSEFFKHTINLDIDKMNYPQLILMVLNLALIIVDIFVYKCFSAENKAYLYLFFSHIIVVFTGVLWIIYYHKIREKLEHSYNGIILVIYCNITLYWCVFMNVSMFTTNKQVSAYIIGSFAIASMFYIAPLVSLFMQGLAYIIMLIALTMVTNNHIGINNIINLTFTIIFSNVVAITIFMHYLKDYINNKQVIENNKRLEKMSIERTEFLANVSHELRTPLNIIYTAQQMLIITAERENLKSDNCNKYMCLIKQNTYRLTRLINNLLDITKIDASSFAVEMYNTDIVKVIEDITLSTVDYVESKGIALIFDTDEEELIMACDSECIERIVLNLLSNAVKFTDRGGRIVVKVKRKKDYVVFSVEDTGIGIAKDMHEKIFKRFEQVDKSIRRNSEGTGIGLSLVQALVELHHGFIELYSEVNQGSTFVVNLPIKVIYTDALGENKIINNKRIETIDIEFSDIYN